MSGVDEAGVEDAALAWLRDLGWSVAAGPSLLSDDGNGERTDYGAVVLEQRLRSALTRLNPGLPEPARQDAYRRLLSPQGSTLEARNRSVHRMLVDGVAVEFKAAGGDTRGAQARVVDFDRPDPSLTGVLRLCWSGGARGFGVSTTSVPRAAFG